MRRCNTPTIFARSPRATASRVKVSQILAVVNEFLADKRDYIVVTESGDMLFGGLDIRVPHNNGYFAQGFYASMGFAVPAALGAQIGSGVRPLVMCGDGGFQMTGPEISHAPAKGVNPIVVLINNGGWGIFRPIAERRELLEDSAVAICATRARLGRRRIRGDHSRTVARRAAEPRMTANRSRLSTCGSNATTCLR